MADIIFYEKPGCLGNGKQKQLLRDAGHTLDVRDLLTTPWTEDSLMPFVSGVPVADWFNRTAPRIKRGDLIPEALTPEAAIKILIADPILIRRPLMQSGPTRMIGFDADAVDRWVGLAKTAPHGRIEGCVAASQATGDPMGPCPDGAIH